MPTIASRVLDTGVVLLDCRKSTDRRTRPVYAGSHPLWQARWLLPGQTVIPLSETLISLPANEGIAKHFQAGLARRGVVWLAGIEVDSLDLIETYAANGFGIGWSVAAPKTRISSRVRVLKLDDFVPVVVGALWRGELKGPTEAFFGGTPASSTTVASRAPRTPRRNEQLIE